MTEQAISQVAIATEGDIVLTRRIVREVASSLGFGLTDRTKIVTAASELARNIYKYAGSGVMRLRTVNRGPAVGIEIAFEDSGPGIDDIERALEEGFSTSGGLGLGLPGTRRLMDEMLIESKPGRGTRILVRKWRRGGGP
jgi:serine/threonine-protein kinase RsbT